MSEEDIYELEQELKLNKQESWRLSDLAYERQQKIEKLSKINKKLKNELQQKENIIKEVREYCENNKEFTDRLNDILEILDKENKDIELDMLKALNTDLDDDVEMG